MCFFLKNAGVFTISRSSYEIAVKKTKNQTDKYLAGWMRE